MNCNNTITTWTRELGGTPTETNLRGCKNDSNHSVEKTMKGDNTTAPNMAPAPDCHMTDV